MSCSRLLTLNELHPLGSLQRQGHLASCAACQTALPHRLAGWLALTQRQVVAPWPCIGRPTFASIGYSCVPS